MRALRKLGTYSRRQAVMEGVLERDDEIRAMEVVSKTLEKLESKPARRRIVRYMVDRHLTPEPEERALLGTVRQPCCESEREDGPPLTHHQSLAIAKRNLATGGAHKTGGMMLADGSYADVGPVPENWDGSACNAHHKAICVECAPSKGPA